MAHWSAQIWATSASSSSHLRGGRQATCIIIVWVINSSGPKRKGVQTRERTSKKKLHSDGSQSIAGMPNSTFFSPILIHCPYLCWRHPVFSCLYIASVLIMAPQYFIPAKLLIRIPFPWHDVWEQAYADPRYQINWLIRQANFCVYFYCSIEWNLSLSISFYV